MSKSTPGPWAVRMGLNERETVCSVWSVQSWRPMQIDAAAPVKADAVEANARLIAAAPEMLEALQSLLPGLALDLRYANDDDDRDAMRSRIDTVVAAIARATGAA